MPPGRLLPSYKEEENEIFQCSIFVANSITAGTCSKRCNFQQAEIENLAANEMANDQEVQIGPVSHVKHLEKTSDYPTLSSPSSAERPPQCLALLE